MITLESFTRYERVRQQQSARALPGEMTLPPCFADARRLEMPPARKAGIQRAAYAAPLPIGV